MAIKTLVSKIDAEQARITRQVAQAIASLIIILDAILRIIH